MLASREWSVSTIRELPASDGLFPPPPLLSLASNAEGQEDGGVSHQPAAHLVTVVLCLRTGDELLNRGSSLGWEVAARPHQFPSDVRQQVPCGQDQNETSVLYCQGFFSH